MRLIDADELKKHIKIFSIGCGCSEDYQKSFLSAIDEQPTIEPESRWIPCSKTIDIPDHEVLCCDRRGEELIGWLSYIDDQWLCESDGEMMYNPVAWREKPEPYREGY